MAIKLKNSQAFNDRHPAPLQDALSDSDLALIKGGMIITQNTDGKHALADGDTGDVKIVLTDGSRADVKRARAITFMTGPDTVSVDTAAYVGTPAKNDAMIIGSGGDKGKLVVQVVTTVAHLKAVVAYCTKAPNSDGFAEFKFIR